MEPVLNTRTKLILAADRVVRDKGVSKLTLEEVARVASVSKGGLLYHFATKEQLIQSMLQYALDAFEEQLEAMRAGDTSPGAWLRAYIKASFPSVNTAHYEQSMIGSALLASVGSDTALTAPYRAHLQRWVARAEQDGIDPSVAQTVRLAADALWLHETLGMQPYKPAERARLIEAMVAMTRIESAPSPAARRGKR